MAVIKRQVQDGQLQSLHEAMAMADIETEKSSRSTDFREGIGHFLQRRKPAFPDR